MLTVKKQPKVSGRSEQMWLVKDGARVVGFITKFKNTKTDTHPWKAFSGAGLWAEFRGITYDGLSAAVWMLRS